MICCNIGASLTGIFSITESRNRTACTSLMIKVNDIKICAFSLRKNHICKFLLDFKSNF